MNLTKNLNNVDIVTPIPTLEERDQGQSLVPNPEIISWEFVSRSLMESCISFQSFQDFPP